MTIIRTEYHTKQYKHATSIAVKQIYSLIKYFSVWYINYVKYCPLKVFVMFLSKGFEDLAKKLWTKLTRLVGGKQDLQVYGYNSFAGG